MIKVPNCLTSTLSYQNNTKPQLGTIATYVRQLAWKTRHYYENDGMIKHGAHNVDTANDPKDIKDFSKVYRVYCDVWCSGNGAPMQPFIDQTYDLSREVPPNPRWEREAYILDQVLSHFFCQNK